LARRRCDGAIAASRQFLFDDAGQRFLITNIRAGALERISGVIDLSSALM
jgi:hypothetical protein